MLEDVNKELSKFAKGVIRESRRNLTRKQKNSSKSLHKSLDYDLNVSKNSFSLSFLMETYGLFQDKGVSGKKKKYNTSYKYTNKMPPSKPFEKWIKRKGIKGRDQKSGRFISHKSLSFLIARSIYNKGIKPSLFFTKPFEEKFKKMPDELIEKFGLEVEKFLESTTNEILD